MERRETFTVILFRTGLNTLHISLSFSSHTFQCKVNGSWKRRGMKSRHCLDFYSLSCLETSCPSLSMLFLLHATDKVSPSRLHAPLVLVLHGINVLQVYWERERTVQGCCYWCSFICFSCFCGFNSRRKWRHFKLFPSLSILFSSHKLHFNGWGNE